MGSIPIARFIINNIFIYLDKSGKYYPFSWISYCRASSYMYFCFFKKGLTFFAYDVRLKHFTPNSKSFSNFALCAAVAQG